MKRYFYIITLALCVLSLGACKKEQPVGGTATQALAGEWWVQIGGAGDYYSISTYNTATNSPTQMWLNMTNFYGDANNTIFGKVTTNVADKTFSGQNVVNAGNYAGGLTFTVTNAKIVTNGAVGPVSKAATDSIAFTVVFSDDPTTVYTMSGYKRTRFVGDDH